MYADTAPGLMANPGDPSDDCAPNAVLASGFNVGDTDRNGLMEPGEQWLYTVAGGAVDAGGTEGFTPGFLKQAQHRARCSVTRRPRC